MLVKEQEGVCYCQSQSGRPQIQAYRSDQTQKLRDFRNSVTKRVRKAFILVLSQLPLVSYVNQSICFVHATR